MAIVLKGADRLIGALATTALWVSAVTILAVALLGAINVATTNLFNKPIPSGIELTEAGHVMIVFLALAAIQRRHENIAVDILTSQMALRARTTAEILMLVCGLFVFTMIAWRGGVLALHAASVREVAGSFFRFPIYPVKIALALGAAIASLEFARQLVRIVCGIDRVTDGAAEHVERGSL